MTTKAAPGSGLPAQPHGTLQVLDVEAARAVVAAVDEESALWTRREPAPIDFFTLGAASYRDATADLDGYHRLAAAVNPVLRRRFSGLYETVIAGLESVFGSCALIDDLAHPGFHIFGHPPGAENNFLTLQAMSAPTASIHRDRQFLSHQALWSTFQDVDLEHTLTFTLPLELPRYGAGLCFWDPAMAGYADSSVFVRAIQRGIDYPKILQVEPPQVIPYHVGRLFYFMGQGKHQIAPAFNCESRDRRITLQGHGVRCDGAWRLYF